MTTSLHQEVPPLATGLVDVRLLPTAVMGAATGTGTTRPGRTQSDDGSIQLGNPGSCAPGGTTVYVVLDESLSVSSTDGNDPLARRHAETALAISHVASACHCRHDRVALVPFDIGSPGRVPPQRLNRSGVRQLRRGLRRLSESFGHSSNLLPALGEVERLAATSSGAASLVVFSDFLLTDQDPAAALHRLAAFPGFVYAVVLGAQPPVVLLGDPTVIVTRLTPFSPPGTAARAVFDGITLYRTRHTHTPRQGNVARHHETLDSKGELIT